VHQTSTRSARLLIICSGVARGWVPGGICWGEANCW